MTKQLELGQTVYCVWTFTGAIPEVTEQQIVNVQTRKQIRDGKLETVTLYSVSGNVFDEGQDWYSDNKEAHLRLIEVFEEEIVKTAKRLEDMRTRLVAAKVLYVDDISEAK